MCDVCVCVSHNVSRSCSRRALLSVTVVLCVSGAQPVLHGDAEGENETHSVRPPGEDLPPADTTTGRGHGGR